MADFIGAIDQGTTSTRFMIFDDSGAEVSRAQKEHRQILPQAGWVEHDPTEILDRTREVVAEAISAAGIEVREIRAIGLTNQRETTVLWNPKTGQPWGNAIVWQDTRNAEMIKRVAASPGADLIRTRTGLVPATYFSAGKIRWLMDQNPALAKAAAAGELAFGNIDSWLLWNLTGGPDGGVHATDVTNASRTMLMDLETLDWNDQLLELFQVPREILPRIQPSSTVYGETRGDLAPAGIPIAGILGDQQAATVGQVCFTPGEAKNTYGTGNFMLLNLGNTPLASGSGLLTTVCYQWADQDPVYAFEGSIAVTGSAVQWLRDQIGLIGSAPEIETLANSVPDSGGIYFVPAFSGLFAPYWRSDARGAIVGLSRFVNRGHIARATLEAICFQTRDVFEAMREDAGLELEVLRVDGGAVANDTLMQLQADILGVSVVRPRVSETTSLGAAYAAGMAVGVWKDTDELRHKWQEDRQWDPQWSQDLRDARYQGWKKAIERTLDWV